MAPTTHRTHPVGALPVLTARCAANARSYAGLASPRATYAASFGYLSKMPDGLSRSSTEIAFLIGGDLAERLKREMRRLFHRAKRKKANLVGLPHLLERPSNARIPRQPLATVG